MWSRRASSLLTCSFRLDPLALGPISAMIERTINLTAAYSPDRMAITPTITATHAWTSILLLAQIYCRIRRVNRTQDWPDKASQ